MDQEHPIPQQISSYQFRLVGDMTLKQFFQVAAGALISLLIYSTNMAAYVKWPLIIFFFLAGIAFAFFPLEDRPLSKWVVLFLKSIYSPTLYKWTKSETKPQYFQAEPSPAQNITPQTDGPATVVQAKATNSQPQVVESLRLEQREKEFISNVSQHFSVSTKTNSQELFQKTEAPAERGVKPLIIPKIEKSVKPAMEAVSPNTPPTTNTGSKVMPLFAQKTATTKIAEFSQEASPPATPTKTNLIVGQVTDADGTILENAILEIKDEGGRPVRALRSNKLGHFMIVTPLANGKYEILTEKEGFDFETLTFETKGEIVLPLLIKAKNTLQNNQIPFPVKPNPGL